MPGSKRTEHDQDQTEAGGRQGRHDQAIERIVRGGKTAALNVLTNWEERIPEFLAKGVRWLNVHANVFIARGARQHVDLLNRNLG